MSVRLIRYSDSDSEIHGIYFKQSALGSRILGIIQGNDASWPFSKQQTRWLPPATIKRERKKSCYSKTILLESGKDASPHFLVQRNERDVSKQEEPSLGIDCCPGVISRELVWVIKW